MSTLTEVEAAADALPLEDQRKLFRFLAERLQSDTPSPSTPLVNQRGFPVSPGRARFTSADVIRAEEQIEQGR